MPAALDMLSSNVDGEDRLKNGSRTTWREIGGLVACAAENIGSVHHTSFCPSHSPQATDQGRCCHVGGSVTAIFGCPWPGISSAYVEKSSVGVGRSVLFLVTF
jgi:hypothetical protein